MTTKDKLPVSLLVFLLAQVLEAITMLLHGLTETTEPHDEPLHVSAARVRYVLVLFEKAFEVKIPNDPSGNTEVSFFAITHRIAKIISWYHRDDVYGHHNCVILKDLLSRVRCIAAAQLCGVTGRDTECARIAVSIKRDAFISAGFPLSFLDE